MPSIRQYEKYLGLSAFVGRAKKQNFVYIKERIWKRLQGWKEKLLSQAGREVLIKSVIQAIPTYSISCFKLPKGLIKEIETMIRKFWWGYSGDCRKVHWVKWECLCQAKEAKGMGFKEIEKFNEALLAKQVWRMLKNPESLCHRVFKVRFFPDCSILEATSLINGSYAWKSILSAHDVVRKGMGWRIGDGKLMSIKEDKWLPDKVYRTVSSPLPSIPPNAKASTLIDTETRAWKEEEVKHMFLPHKAKNILSIPLSTRLPQDSIIWSKNPSSVFSTQSAYQLLASDASASNPGSSNPHPQRLLWRGVWTL